MAGNIKQVESETVPIEPAVSEAVAAQMRAREIAPLGFNRSSQRSRQEAADIVGRLGQLVLEPGLCMFESLQHLLKPFAGELELGDVVDRALVVEEIVRVVP